MTHELDPDKGDRFRDRMRRIAAAVNRHACRDDVDGLIRGVDVRRPHEPADVNLTAAANELLSGRKAPNKVRRYAVFVGAMWYPKPAWRDFKGSFDDLTEALAFAVAAVGPGASVDHDWYQVVDLETGGVVADTPDKMPGIY